MNLILAILLTMLFIFLIIFSFYKILSCELPLNVDKNSLGRNHCGIVTFSSSGGDIHFDEMSEEEIYNRLKFDYSVFHRFTCPFNKSHLAEYRILTRGGVKTIGYITKDKVVFEGKEYIFDKGEENDS